MFWVGGDTLQPTTATWEHEDTCQWSPFVLSCEEQLFPLLSIACQVGERPGPLSGCQQAVQKLPCTLWCQQLANRWCPLPASGVSLCSCAGPGEEASAEILLSGARRAGLQPPQS